MRLSIIIPVYQEPYLDKTIASVKKNAGGSIEILATNGEKGMRAGINEGLVRAKGDYVMKLDAHCTVAPNFDQILIESCADHRLVIPRRYHLNEETWDKDPRWPVRDYHYLSFPGTSDTTYGYSMQVQNWEGKEGPEIDDTMTFQGSGWVANYKYFMAHIGLLDDSPDTYGPFAQDQQEIGLKYWLGGGEIKVNKRTWYAHLQKRGYHYKDGTFSHRYKKDDLHIHGNEWGTKHWLRNEEKRMIYKFEWLIDKFNPPTWPENWRDTWPQT